MSIWWVVGAFLVGGYAGMLLFALLSSSARRENLAAKSLEVIVHSGLSPLDVPTH